MKTNLFKVKEKKEKRIIIEEERTKNPFLLFLKKNKNFILTSGIMLILCLILVSTGLAFSLFRGSNDYDITYIEGSDIIDSNQDPDVDEEDIKEEILGEIARELGIVLQVKSFMSSQGDVISYFTDGTSIVVKSNGKIYRVSTNKKGEYGINKDGKIDSTAKYVRVTSTTTTLMDGTIITYYSDGTAKVEHNMQTLFIRDSNNIKIDNGSSLNTLNPSGVAPTRETKKAGVKTLKKFTDKTSLITIGGEKYIVNKNTEVTANETDITYDTNNIFAALPEKTYKDGNTITPFANGSAIITEPNGNITYVKRSGDISVSKETQKLYEILPKEKYASRKTFFLNGNKNITYYDNGAAIIQEANGTRKYIEDSDDVLYNKNKHITSTPNFSKLISEKTTTDGEQVFNFDNGKSQVIKENGQSYIIDTDKLTFNTEGEIEDDPLEDDDTSQGGIPNTKDWFSIWEDSSVYYNSTNVNKTTLKIQNTSGNKKSIIITIKEVDNYSEYINTENGKNGSLSPNYVKYIVSVKSANGDTYNTDILGNVETLNNEYIIYTGDIMVEKNAIEVTISLLPDYENLNNDGCNQGNPARCDENKVFAGTIKVYVDDGR